MASQRLVFPDVPQITTVVTIAKGAVGQFRPEIARLGKTFLVVTGATGARKCGALDQVLRALEEERAVYYLFDEIEPNPSIQTLRRCIDRYRNQGIDAVLAVGGGSVMDGAKAINFGLSGADFMQPTDVATVPLVCVATAVGTGSEVTQYAMVNDDDAGIKRAIPNFLHPTLSYVDPSFLETLPQTQITSMYFDMMCHAIESSVTTRSTELQTSYAMQALRSLGNCRGVLSGDRSWSCLQDMCLASVYAGVSIALAGTTIPHGISYYLTYKYKVPHGIACVMNLPTFLEKLCDKEQVRTLMATYGMGLNEFGKLVADMLPADLPYPGAAEKIEYAERLIMSGKCDSFRKGIAAEEVLSVWV